MQVIKATDSTINAIRKMEAVSRSVVKHTAKKQCAFFAEPSTGKYNGPFAVSRINDTLYKVQAAPEFMGGNSGYAGSICAPDMQILAHVSSWEISYSAGQENTLLVLKAIWTENGLRDTEFLFVPDPWKNPSDLTKMLAIDYENPKTTEHPYRNPFISIYPVARIYIGKIEQIQQGHIVEYIRWWRS